MAEEIDTKRALVASRPPLPPCRVTTNNQLCLTRNVSKLDFFQKSFQTEESCKEEFGNSTTHPATSCASPAAYSLSSMSSLSSDETDNISCGHSYFDDRVTYISPQRKKKVNIVMQSPTVPSHLSPFYPDKYVVLGCEESSDIDFLIGTDEKKSTANKCRASILAAEFHNIKILWYFVLLVIVASELFLCFRPHLPALPYIDYHLKHAALGTTSANYNNSRNQKKQSCIIYSLRNLPKTEHNHRDHRNVISA
jgi:hypothetical protein